MIRCDESDVLRELPIHRQRFERQYPGCAPTVDTLDEFFHFTEWRSPIRHNGKPMLPRSAFTEIDRLVETIPEAVLIGDIEGERFHPHAEKGIQRLGGRVHHWWGRDFYDPVHYYWACPLCPYHACWKSKNRAESARAKHYTQEHPYPPKNSS